MVLRWVHKTVNLAAKPFTHAESLKEYATNGYWIFGGITAAILILFLIVSGYIKGIVSPSPASAQPFIEILLKKVGLEGVPVTLPVSLLVVIFYVALGLFPKTCVYIGEKLTNFFYNCVSFVITMGEWCIEHRGSSTVLVVILVGLFIWGFKGVIDKSRRETLLATNFHVWLQGAERFVVQDTFTKIQNKKIEDVNEHWQDDLQEVLEIPGGYLHPAAMLHDAIEQLNSKNGGQEINQFLATRADPLDKLVKQCERECRPVEEMDESERRAYDLLYILMGKIFNRIGGNDEQRLLQSYQYFDKVDLKYYEEHNTGPSYLFSVNNGKGTTYAGLFTVLLQKSGAKVPICQDDAAQCALKAFDAYDNAAKDAPPCSDEGRRRANNLTDLLTRLGVNYPTIVNRNWQLKQRAKMSDKETFAKNIEEHVAQMLKCNEEAETVPDFLTIAQAYATCAALKGPEGKDVPRLMRTSGLYLHLAYSYEPANLTPNPELLPFCQVIAGGSLAPAFQQGIELEEFGGLQSLDLDVLTQAIKEECGKVTSLRQ